MFGTQCVNEHIEIDVGRASALWQRGGGERRNGRPVRIGQIGRIVRRRESALTFWHTILLRIRKPCPAS